MTTDNIFAPPDNEVGSGQVIAYSKTEAELSALREICATTVFDEKTASGMKQATSLRAKVRTLRTGVEKLRKEAKAPVLALGKLIDSEAERLTIELLALEKPIDEKIKAEELRKAEEKKIEAERITKVQEWFDNLNKAVIDCVGQSSAFIKDKIDEIAEYEVLTVSMFKERGDEAIKLKSSTLKKLNVMLHFAGQGEKDRAELAEKTKQLEGSVDDFEALPPVPDGYDSWLDYANNPKGDSNPDCEPDAVCDDVGIEYSEFEEIVSDMVAIPRAEYERLLRKQKNPVIVLSGKHIKEIAEFAGFSVTDMTGDKSLLDTEYDIYEYPNTKMLDDDGNVYFYEFTACLREYPEDGYMPIGSKINQENK